MINPIRIAIKHLEILAADPLPPPGLEKLKNSEPGPVTKEDFAGRVIIPSQAMLGFTEAFLGSPLSKSADPKMISMVKSLESKTQKAVGTNRGKATDLIKDTVSKAFGKVTDLPEDEQAMVVLKAFQEAWRVLTSAVRASLPDDSSKDQKKLYTMLLNWKPSPKGMEKYFALAKTFRGLAPQLAVKLPEQERGQPDQTPQAPAGTEAPDFRGESTPGKKPVAPPKSLGPDQEKKFQEMFLVIKGKKGRWSEQPVRDWFKGQLEKARMSQRSRQFYSNPKSWRGSWKDFKNLATVVSAKSLVSDFTTLARFFDKVK